MPRICEHEHFWFAGFLPREASARNQLYNQIDKRAETTIVMDTPYRLKKVLEELKEHTKARNWQLFFACDLLSEKELLIRGSIELVYKPLYGEKKEFILVISPNYGKNS